MSFLIVAGVLFAVLFALAYIRPGRAGVAILALLAGHELAELWAAQLGAFSAHAADKLDVPLWPGVFYVALVLTPAALLMLLGKGTTSRVPRLLSALAVGILAVTLLVPMTESIVLIDPASRTLHDALSQRASLIITITLVIGFADLLFMGNSKPHGHSKD